MFGTLLMKEIHETVTGGKFLIATVLCLVLIPLGMFVTLKDYEQRQANYRNAEQLYEQRSEGKVGPTFKAEGYRPPSPLSVFAVGLEQFLPNKAVTSDARYAFWESTEGIIQISNESSLHNPMSLLFGKMDFLFNVSFVLSIFVLLSTFSVITGEREQGTLKLMMSNPVPRWIVLAAKIAGSYLVFLAPFIASCLIGLLLIGLSGAFPLNGAGIAPAVLAIIAVTILFLLCLFTLGVLVSSTTRNSILSIIVLLFIWTMFALVIPKLSPMVAQIIKPVESEQVVASKIQNTRADIKQEQLKREDDLFIEVMARHGGTVEDYFDMERGTPERTAIEAEYDELVAPVRADYAERLSVATANLQRDYDNSVHEQETVSMLISRISPISCFTYILTELAGTGVGEIDNFKHQAEQFQEHVKETVYDKFRYRQYGAGGYNMGFYAEPGVDAGSMPIPEMTGYRRATVAGAFGRTWPDILLLAIYTVLFFAGAFVRFLRYDVR